MRFLHNGKYEGLFTEGLLGVGKQSLRTERVRASEGQRERERFLMGAAGLVDGERV